MINKDKKSIEKLVISVGITGSSISKKQTPYIPITPKEIANSGIEAWKAGASVLHIHVRNPKTCLGTQNVKIFKEVVDRIRGETDAILCLTTSGIPGKNLPTYKRLQSLSLNPEMVSFDAGSINLNGKVFINSPEFLETLAKETLSKGIKPELEIFEPGMVYTCIDYMKKGLIKKPLHFQFVFGAKGGMPADTKLLTYLTEIIPYGSTWSAIGIGQYQLGMNIISMTMGGHVRTGLEDNIYYSKGVLAKSNAQLVERVVKIAYKLGREAANPEEARKILSLN